MLDIAIAPTRRITLPGVHLHRRQVLAGEQTVYRGIRTTTLARTLFDLATLVDFQQLESAVDHAFTHKRLNIEDIHKVLGNHPRAEGSRRLKRILFTRSRGDARFRSRMERKAFQHLTLSGLSEGCVSNFEIVDANNKDRVLDFAWPMERIALEFDSFTWHTGRRSWAEDRRRANAVVAAGWTVVVATDADLDDQLRNPISSLTKLLTTPA